MQSGYPDYEPLKQNHRLVAVIAFYFIDIQHEKTFCYSVYRHFCVFVRWFWYGFSLLLGLVAVLPEHWTSIMVAAAALVPVQMMICLCRLCVLSLHSEVGDVRQYTRLKIAMDFTEGCCTATTTTLTSIKQNMFFLAHYYFFSAFQVSVHMVKSRATATFAAQSNAAMENLSTLANLAGWVAYSNLQ